MTRCILSQTRLLPQPLQDHQTRQRPSQCLDSTNCGQSRQKVMTRCLLLQTRLLLLQPCQVPSLYSDLTNYGQGRQKVLNQCLLSQTRSQPQPL